ncbi:lipoprotein [Bordetella pertussis]|nr:lipoprotein [Bordetella pertussis]
MIERPPEQLFSKVVDFWTDTGFTVSVNNPQAGIIETDWAENRAQDSGKLAAPGARVGAGDRVG